MATAAAPIDTPQKEGIDISVGLAAVQCWRGAAAAVILGTGYATPLVVGTPGTQFIGVFQESYNNVGAAAGAKFVSIKRKGVFRFNQTGLTQAAVQQRAFFSDDNTVTLTANGNYAGKFVTVDSANGYAWVEIDDAVLGSDVAAASEAGFVLSASGAVNPSVAATYVITKAGVAALTLAAPVAGTDDFKEITLISATANQHTLTATGLYLDGASHVNVATWPAAAGGSLTLMAYQAKWYVVSLQAVVMS